MESLQRLAALPLVDNACASRANKDSWSYSVYCREVLGELEDLFSARRSLKIGAKSGGKARLTVCFFFHLCSKTFCYVFISHDFRLHLGVSDGFSELDPVGSAAAALRCEPARRPHGRPCRAGLRGVAQ